MNAGLDEIARRPDAPVLVIHARDDIADEWHEAHVDAARKAYPAFAVVAFRGYSGPVEAYAGRDVVFWPWMAQPSARALLKPFAAIVARTAQRVRLIAPPVSDMHGPADLNGHNPIDWAKANVEDVAPAQDHEVADLEAEWFGTAEPEAPPLVSDYTPNHPDLIEPRDVWPEPIDVFSRAAVPALPRGILPPAIEPFIFDQSEIVGSDPCILAVSALVCAAACCHDSIKLQPRRYDPDWKESARLWGAFVGDPSVKKTPALSRAMSHVRKLDIEMAEECERAMPAYRVAEKRYKKAEDKAADNPSLPIPEPPERPPNRRLIAEDTTIEKLSDLLVDNRGGLLIHHDELSGFFGSFDAYRANGGKDQAFWLQAYNGGARRVDRISRGSIVVPNLSVCIVGGIQPDKIREMASKLADDGLVQRFMVTIASETAGIGSDRPPDRGAVQAYRGILDWLVKERGHEEPIRLSDGALDVMRDVEERLKAYRSLGSMPTRLRSHLGKWDGLFCRLCLLYHAIESVERGESPAGMVSQDNAERVRLWLIAYLLPHTMAFYDDVLGHSGALAHVQWVAGYILAKPDETEVSNRDLYRAYRAWRPMQDVAKWQIMGTLETCGWLRPHPDTKPHSAASRWVINPVVRAAFSELGAAEKEKRDVAKERLLRAFMNGS